MPNHARAAALLVAALTVACGGEPEQPTPRADLAGTWDLVTVNGAALPTPSPEEPNIVLESVVMRLDAGGAYSLASSFAVSGRPAPQQMTIAGSWVASDDALTFHTEQGPAIVQFGYRRDGGEIRMVDEQGNEWQMRRR